MHLRRVIGSYSEGRPGPLLICVGGIHGNEWAGVKAMDLLIKMLEVEPITNPQFEFYGRLVLLLGNLPALEQHTRFLDVDLNRIWSEDFIEGPRTFAETSQLLELKDCIEREIDAWASEVALIDLHTTTAAGGIFSLPANDKESLALAEGMHAPVITNLVDRVDGNLIKYFTEKYVDKNLRGVVFEGGQHEDQLSVNRCIAAMINCIRSLGLVDPDHIVNRHDELLRTYSRGLPKVAALRYVHQINPNDAFEMLPGYRNFQPVEKGTVVAKDKDGMIEIREDGLILMPLYQAKGDDGFFVVRETE